jgi:hypothetical protein
MNNEVLKKVGIYLVGTILGGAIGYLIADYFVSNTEEKVEEENEWAKDEEESEEIESGYGLKRVNIEDIDKLNTTDFKPKDYNAISTKHDKTQTIDEVVKERLGKDESLTGTKSPYIISLEDYIAGVALGTPHNQIALSYYEKDLTVVDSEDAVIDSPNEILGEEALKSFGKYSQDPDIVYVRNFKLATDYEVIRLHSSYSETILGLPVVDKKKKVRKDRDRTRKVDKINDPNEDE